MKKESKYSQAFPSPYTDEMLGIISGTTENPDEKEVAKVIGKAYEEHDRLLAEALEEKYGIEPDFSDEDKPTYTLEEAIEILHQLDLECEEEEKQKKSK